MKGKSAGLLFSLALLAAPASSFALPVTVLHSFDGTNGAQPTAALVQGADGNFYGTAANGGGSCGCGTVFRMTPAGAVTVLHTFSGDDGSHPGGALLRARDGNFYGTTEQGGAHDSGTIFRITPAGAFTRLHSFAEVISYQNADGANPVGALVQDADGTIYGTALVGGLGGGSIFRLSSSGVVTAVHHFTYDEGELPRAGLTRGPDGNFYGTTIYYGTTPSLNPGFGSFYRFAPGNLQFTVLHVFNGTEGGVVTQLALAADGNFYATSAFYGATGDGAVIRITPSGSVTTLHSFGPAPDGLQPQDGVVQGVDGNFYGTTLFGGSQGGGTVFRTTPTGVTTVLHDFEGFDGAYPWGALVRGSDGNFYGTTQYGGAFGQGVVFRIEGPASPPQWISPPTPADRAEFTLTISRPFSLALRASNTAPLEAVHIGASGVPAGSKFTSFDGNPANATLAWTPAAGQAGDYKLTVNASNVSSAAAAPPRILKLRVLKRQTALRAQGVLVKMPGAKLQLKMSGVLQALDPAQALAGKRIRFQTRAGELLCEAVTDNSGLASCGTLSNVLTTTLTPGYIARFAGDDGYRESEALGGIIQ